MATTVAGAGGALALYVLYEKNKNAKNMLIADVIVQSLPNEIEIGQRTGKVIVVNGEYFTTVEYMNYLNIALGIRRNRPGQLQQAPNDQFADRSGIENSTGANQFADRFGIGRGGKYRKTRKTRKSRKIRKH
jgi:hypothetical protein